MKEPYFDPEYQPTKEELQGESFAACYSQQVVIPPPEDHEHHQ